MIKMPYDEWERAIRTIVCPNYAPLDPKLLRSYSQKTSAIKIIDVTKCARAMDEWVKRLRGVERAVVLVALTPESEAVIFKLNYQNYLGDRRPNVVVFNDIVLASKHGVSLFSKVGGRPRKEI